MRQLQALHITMPPSLSRDPLRAKKNLDSFLLSAEAQVLFIDTIISWLDFRKVDLKRLAP